METGGFFFGKQHESVEIDFVCGTASSYFSYSWKNLVSVMVQVYYTWTSVILASF